MSMHYTFRSSRGTSVTMLRGEGAPKMTGGGGGWEITPRPRRVALTIWKGREPYQMDIPILFDGWKDSESQEQRISTLNQMQMGADLEEPPTVQVDGGIPVKGAKWVMTIDWGDNVIWQSSPRGEMFRLRQDAVVHLIQFNPEDRLKVQGKGNLRSPRRYTVRKGDDLRSISQKMYGTPTRWKEIQTANHIRDPKKISTMVGKSIRIPA